MRGPPTEQVENADEDDDSTYVSNEEGSEKDNDSIPSISSLQEVPIHHNTDDFETLTEITDVANNTNVDDVGNNVTTGENIPEDEIDDNTFTTGVSVPDDVEEEEDDDNALTTGVIVQDEEEKSSSSSEEASDEEPTQMAGVHQDEEEDMMAENETPQAKINERDVQVNILPPTNESNNQQSIEDQIIHIEQEMDQSYGTRILGGLR
eukprot:15363578-Ditylum_brightwellii.AAC.1